LRARHRRRRGPDGGVGRRPRLGAVAGGSRMRVRAPLTPLIRRQTARSEGTGSDKIEPVAPHRLAGEALVGSLLHGRYRIVQLLGSGGTGHVYLAEDAEAAGTPARVAIKMLRAEHLASAQLLARFEREAVAAARVNHPNVLRVLDVGVRDEAAPFFVMELLVG